MIPGTRVQTPDGPGVVLWHWLDGFDRSHDWISGYVVRLDAGARRVFPTAELSVVREVLARVA